MELNICRHGNTFFFRWLNKSPRQLRLPSLNEITLRDIGLFENPYTYFMFGYQGDKSNGMTTIEQVLKSLEIFQFLGMQFDFSEILGKSI